MPTHMKSVTTQTVGTAYLTNPIAPNLAAGYATAPGVSSSDRRLLFVANGYR